MLEQKHFVNQFHLNKKKIINDPVFGFINLQSELVFDLLEQPAFQRLRRIKQLGLSYLVFPGANHSRFEHALGATHLMRQAISVLRLKGHEITNEENSAISQILQEIKNGTRTTNKEQEIKELLECNSEGGRKIKIRADLFLKKGSDEYYIEIKTAKPNIDDNITEPQERHPTPNNPTKAPQRPVEQASPS